MTGDQAGTGPGSSLPPLASLTSPDLLLSIRIPVGSDLQGGPDLLRIGIPVDEGAPRRPTFAIRSGAPEEPGEDWFATFRDGAVARMPVTVDGFQLLRRQDFVLSSFVDVTAVYYRRRVPGAGQRSEQSETVSQLQAYLWATSYRMYVVDAATSRDREREDLPLFDAMLRSIRLLPPPPGG